MIGDISYWYEFYRGKNNRDGWSIWYIQKRRLSISWCLAFYFFCAKWAFHVFSMRVATVIGQTPPGVGVIARIVSLRSSKSVSPLATPSTKVFPTSITTDSEWSMSRVISPGEPAATITISAFLVFSERFFVELLQLVTVAPALIIISAIGFPTIFDRQTITTFFPATSIL